jgi:MFS family permease
MLYLYIGYEFLGFDERFYMDEESSKIKNRTEGLGWRVSLSILIGVGWLVFLILWLFFYAYPLSEWEKNVAILLMSLLVICGILGIPWAIWAIRNQSAQEKELWEIKGFKWRLWVSIILGAAVFLFLIYWFWYQALPYSVFQNIAIFIVAFLIIGGILGAMWAPWSMKHKPDHHHSDERKKDDHC